MNSDVISSKAKEILCVEKQAEICLLLSLMLPRDEFRVSHRRNIQQAIDLLRLRPPIIMVIENQFFERIGLEFIAQVKSLRPETKVIILSAEGGLLEEAVIRAGADAFLTKPFTKAELLHSVLSLAIN